MTSTYEHGNWLRYDEGCRCDPCRTAWRVYQGTLELRHLRGEVWADPDEYRTIVGGYCDTWGVTVTAIRKAAGLHHSTINHLLGGNRHVHEDVASRLRDLTLDDFPAGTFVGAELAWEQLDRLDAAGVGRPEIASTLGWSRWPSGSYPNSRRVKLWFVRALTEMADEITRPRCETCGDDPMPGGARQCARCFSRATWPSRSDMDLIARREQDRLRKRAERAARREVAA